MQVEAARLNASSSLARLGKARVAQNNYFPELSVWPSLRGVGQQSPRRLSRRGNDVHTAQHTMRRRPRHAGDSDGGEEGESGRPSGEIGSSVAGRGGM